ncbi:MAG: MotA/TolQ/ExbB proton channel family protein [Prevotella sp.]|jgi:biopolymer transport protein ExbB|nr:MotA/TolQ/ExbB proton channel family protein [Prevotella sp.]
MKKHIMSLAMALAMFLSVVPAVNAQPQQNIQEVQMKQPKAQPEDAATEKADEEASKAEEAADKAEANGGTAEAGAADTATDDMLKDAADEGATDEDKPMAAAGQQTENVGIYKSLKTKFIEGNAGFMSLVALALVIGLAFCIERIIYLSLSEINAKKFMKSLDDKISANDIDGAKDLCRNTRGPVASICYQGLVRIHESLDNIERSVVSYGSVQSANLEKGCSWITLFIAMAPSLGFLGTVIGMVMAFDQIQAAGDISPTIVAAGMKVALITTIFGIIVALILQIFYNYILSKIEHITAQMEESAITLLDSIAKHKLTAGGQDA